MWTRLFKNSQVIKLHEKKNKTKNQRDNNDYTIKKANNF